MGNKEELKLTTFGSSKPTTVQTRTTHLQVKLVYGTYTTLNANVVPQIAGNIVRKPIGNNIQEKYKHLFEMTKLADNLPTKDETSSIELLIGNDYYLDLVLMQRIQIQPALYSLFGWLLTERLENTERRTDTDTTFGILVVTKGHVDIQDTGICANKSRPPRREHRVKQETRVVLKGKQRNTYISLQYDIHEVTSEQDIVQHLLNMDCQGNSTRNMADTHVNTTTRDSVLVKQKNTAAT